MTKFRPCIDLHAGQVKQIVGGSLTDNAGDLVTNFVAEKDSAWYADLYKTNQLTGGHVIMLGPGNKEAALAALGAYPRGLQVGGGITVSNAQEFLDAGASHVIVTSSIFSNDQLDMDKLKALSQAVTPSRLVLDLSCRRRGNSWYVATNRWQTVTSTEITADTLQTLSQYCAEFLVHAADVEGLQKGIDVQLVQFLGEHCPIPVTYAGGARSTQDLEQVKTASQGRVDLTIGSALDVFGGKCAFSDCVAWNQAQSNV